jgi:tRNA(Ile)-lysidine synthase
MPSEKMLIRIVKEVLRSKQSANPEVKNKFYCIRRYRHKLYCFNAEAIDFIETEKPWEKGLSQLHLKSSVLTLSDAAEGISKALWNNSKVSVKFRQGSEKIKLPGRNGHHSLKNLFQEAAIPPWERDSVPLVYLDGRLAAIADLWISENFFCDSNKDCLKIHWAGLGGFRF